MTSQAPGASRRYLMGCFGACDVADPGRAAMTSQAPRGSSQYLMGSFGACDVALPSGGMRAGNGRCI